MLVVALGCIAAGTWQVTRFEQKVRENHEMDHNAHAAAVRLTTRLIPLVGEGLAPDREAIRFRTVTASGTYLLGAPEFLRNQSLNGVNGYDVISRLDTGADVLLVVRGFVAAENTTGAPPATIVGPPVGVVHVAGRLQTPDTKPDAAGNLRNGELETINPAEQKTRLGAPVYDAYVTLNADQPGTAGVSALPGPDLSNPAGGAVPAQHLAYIVQWYLFALFALAAPFAIARYEVRDARRRFLGMNPDDAELDDPSDRAALPAPSGGGIAVRDRGTVARRGEPTPEQWERAAQLADRYGRSLGMGQDAAGASVQRSRRVGRRRAIGGPYQLPNSATTVQSAHGDAYHSAYNDYLWELALADGATPPASTALPTNGTATPLGTSSPTSTSSDTPDD